MDNANPTAANPVPNPGPTLDIPVADASPDQASLDAHISEVLGLPTQEVKTSDTATAGADGGVGKSTIPSDGGELPSGTGSEGRGTKTEDLSGDQGAEGSQGTDAAAEAAKSGDKGSERKTSEKPVPSDKTPDGPALSLTVTDKNGKEFTLKPGDNLDEVLADFEPKNTGQIMKIISDLQQLNADQKAQDEDRATQAAAEEAQASRAAQVESWDNEISDLQTAKRVPVPQAKPGTPAWKTDPAVVRVNQVFEFMTKENAKRQAAGSSNFITSFEDALDKVERVELAAKLDRQASTNTTTADEAAKLKAGRIQGAGAKSNNAPPIYRPGQHTSIWDVEV